MAQKKCDADEHWMALLACGLGRETRMGHGQVLGLVERLAPSSTKKARPYRCTSKLESTTRIGTLEALLSLMPRTNGAGGRTIDLRTPSSDWRSRSRQCWVLKWPRMT
eukprot:scaffold12680_cov154-Cylindrotheca_fusiformis.AAC.1